MSGINYYKRMKQIFDDMDKTVIGDKQVVKEQEFMNLFTKDQGLSTATAFRWKNQAVDIGVIHYVKTDNNGFDYIYII